MDKTDKICSVARIVKACGDPLAGVLENLPYDQLHWKPAPEARSIAEIFRHLIRVNGYVLQQFGYLPAAVDPGVNTGASNLLTALNAITQQLLVLIEHPSTYLDAMPEKPIVAGHDSLGEWFIHLGQHYLYHLAQLSYLRRAQDREWAAPQKEWEAATYVISEELACMR